MSEQKSRTTKKCVKNVHDGIGTCFRFTYQGIILGVRGHRFEYDVVSLIDLFSEGLAEEATLFKGSSKARACG